MRVLVVEDDPLLGDGITAALKLRGWAVDWVRTAAQAGAAQAGTPFDAVVLDLGLPDGDSVDLLRGSAGVVVVAGRQCGMTDSQPEATNGAKSSSFKDQSQN